MLALFQFLLNTAMVFLPLACVLKTSFWLQEAEGPTQLNILWRGVHRDRLVLRLFPFLHALLFWLSSVILAVGYHARIPQVLLNFLLLLSFALYIMIFKPLALRRDYFEQIVFFGILTVCKFCVMMLVIDQSAHGLSKSSRDTLGSLTAVLLFLLNLFNFLTALARLISILFANYKKRLEGNKFVTPP